MTKTLAVAAFLTIAVPVAALANSRDCGDNAFTHAEVVEAKPGLRAKGPITSIPDSLCADLIEDRPAQVDSLHVSVGDGGAVGGARAPAQAPQQKAPRSPHLGR